MTPELARAALEFLKRTELRGVETFVMHALLQELERDASQRANGAGHDSAAADPGPTIGRPAMQITGGSA